MKKTALAIILTGWLIPGLLWAADQPRQLAWADLIPAHLRTQSLYAGMDQDQQDMARWVINMLENLPDREPDTEQYYQEVDEAMSSLKKAGIDLVDIMAKRKKMRTSVVEALGGQQIRLPGYLLPLDVSGGKVKEFLLVPYMGACIHTPPPPPNQIVYVNVLLKEGYRNKELFEPVWITGEMAIKRTSKELFLTDGTADIAVGYALQAHQIEPYKE